MYNTDMKRQMSADQCDDIRGTLHEWVQAGDLLVGVGSIALRSQREILTPQRRTFCLDYADQPLTLPDTGLVIAGQIVDEQLFHAAVYGNAAHTMPLSAGIRGIRDVHAVNEPVQKHYMATAGAKRFALDREAAGDFGMVARVDRDHFAEYADRLWTHQAATLVPIIDSLPVSTAALSFNFLDLPPPEAYPALSAIHRERWLVPGQS
jgi:hypothetical protein